MANTPLDGFVILDLTQFYQGPYATMMLEELRKVIPSFLSRVDREERGVAWSAYLAETRHGTRELVERIFAGERAEPRPAVTLTDFDPDAEDKLLAAMLYPFTDLPEDQVLARVRRLSAGERSGLHQPVPNSPLVPHNRLTSRRYAVPVPS